VFIPMLGKTSKNEARKDGMTPHTFDYDLRLRSRNIAKPKLRTLHMVKGQ